jgi:subtilisin family serine protease
MKRKLLSAVIIAMLTLAAAKPAAAQQRYIVRTTGGLNSVLNLCLSANCQVQGSLDGPIGQTYLVTTTSNILQALVGGVVNFLEALLGIQSIEPDQLLPMPLLSVNSAPYGLTDTAPVNYFGTVVTHGYAAQPAGQIIRVTDAQNGFGVSGTGIVAVIDTGVDIYHPVLVPVLLPGYDFTRNQPGASEWLDMPQWQNGNQNQGGNSQGAVQQQSAAILDQQSAAILDGPPCGAFGHGTMTSGVVHLVAPNAKILPLKAFSSSGTGYLSNIIAALYYAVQHNANVVNMSFDLSTPSSALSQAASYANHANVVLLAAAGNEDTSARVYPAALNGKVMGIASTTNWDARSSFSNYGSADVWIGAPGEYVISTFPGGGYAAASGTSFSSPLVAGTAALLLNAKSGLNQSQAASALSHGRLLTPDLNHGRLDAYQAISAWVNSSSSSSSTSSSSGSCLLLCL